MSSRCVSNEISNMICGFELVTERYLLNEIIADGFQQFCEAKNLFVPVMRASKLLNIPYNAVSIYGGPHYTYGELIHHITTLDFVIRYKLGKIVSGIFDQVGFKIKDLPAECVEQFFNKDENRCVGNRSGGRKLDFPFIEKNIVDYVFGDHILGKSHFRQFSFSCLVFNYFYEN